MLIWDVDDSRHRIHGRHDTENLARMYYHIMSNVVTYRWPDTAIWQLHADERGDMNWRTLEDTLQFPPRKLRNSTKPLIAEKSVSPFGRRVHVNQVKSSNEPLVQVADLFAGLAAFSWNKHVEYHGWRSRELGQLDMFSDLTHPKLSKSEAYKARALQHLYFQCSRRGLRISLDHGEGLRTRDPSMLINFWFYTPQHAEDRAPTRHE